jgi:hypothetical protein
MRIVWTFEWYRMLTAQRIAEMLREAEESRRAGAAGAAALREAARASDPHRAGCAPLPREAAPAHRRLAPGARRCARRPERATA